MSQKLDVDVEVFKEDYVGVQAMNWNHASLLQFYPNGKKKYYYPPPPKFLTLNIAILVVQNVWGSFGKLHWPLHVTITNEFHTIET
jgi:hypothetical protein